MEKRIFGRTGLSVVPMGFGTMELRYIDQQQAAILLNTAFDRGVNYIDTSPEYPRAEEYIGNTIAHRRNEFYLENHRGIIEFSSQRIRINLSRGFLELQGENLEIKALMPDEMKVLGEIRSINYID
jgi:sporulation protein YqfC